VVKIGFLSFVLFVEIGISIMLFLSGVNPGIFGGLVSTFSKAVGVSAPNVTGTSQTGYIQGDQSSMSKSFLSGSNGMYFNIFTVLLGSAVAIGFSGLLGVSNFSAIYVVPGLMIIMVMWVILSPIIGVINIIISDPIFAPLGWVLWLVFLAMNIWGVISFIRGYEG